MLSTAFILKRLEFTDSQETVLWVAWNKVENYIAAGGQGGSVRLLLFDFNASSDPDYHLSDFRAATRKVKVVIDKRLNLHENSLITCVAWNEKETKLATSDKKGLIFISSTETGKWVRNLVNDSTRSAVVTTTWSPDASRILMLYVSGLVMLGTASGHRIFNGTINRGSPPKFGLVASNTMELYVIGFADAICCYNFNGDEIWSVKPLLATNDTDQFVHGCWGYSSEAAYLTALSPTRECAGAARLGAGAARLGVGPTAGCSAESAFSHTLIAVTSNGMLCVYSVLTGELLSSVSMEITPTFVQASPGGHMLSVTGSVQSSNSFFGRRQLQDSASFSNSANSTAITVVYRTSDLAVTSRLRLPEQIATSSSWDSSGLRLVIAAGKHIYLVSVRPSYNQYLMAGGTLIFSMDSCSASPVSNASFMLEGNRGSLLQQQYQQQTTNVGALFGKKAEESEGVSMAISSFEERVINRARNNECVFFWKPGLQLPYQRWPAKMISFVGCRNYVAILSLKANTVSTRRYCTHIMFYTSVCAPIFSIDLAYVPFYTAGTGNYLVCATTSRISVIDIRSLATEAIGIGSTEKSINRHLYEWHADSSPLAPDRELMVAKLTVNNPVIGVTCCDTALFVARSDDQVQRYSLPSLTLLENIPIRPNMDYMQTNCNGTILACVHEDGSLVFYYTKDFYSEALYAANAPTDKKRASDNEPLTRGGTSAKPSRASQKPTQGTILDGDADTAAALGFGTESVAETEDAPYVIKADVQVGYGAHTLIATTVNADSGDGADCAIPPYSPNLLGIWGLVFSPEDPNLVAVSSKYAVVVLHLDEQKHEDPIQTSAHIIGFSGLSLIASYLDEIAHSISSLDHAYQVLETQMLRELQTIMFGAQDPQTGSMSFSSLVNSALSRGCLNRNLISLVNDAGTSIPSSLLDSNAPKTIAIKPTRTGMRPGDSLSSGLDVDGNHPSQSHEHDGRGRSGEDIKDTINLAGAIDYVKSHPSVHLYRIIAEASLIILNLEVASYFYIRAGDYVSYHFCESLLRIASEDQKRAEIFMFLGNFHTAESIYRHALSRPDLVIKTQTDLQMWLSIIRTAKLSRAPGGNLLIDDKLLERAHKAIGLYYLRQQQHTIASDFLKSSGDPYLYAESLFAARRYVDLKNLATSLPAEEFRDYIAKIAVMLARLGDVEGASESLVRINDPYNAIQICLQLKRFDVAVSIASKYNMLHIIDRELSVYLKQLLSAGDDQGALELLRRTNQGEVIAAIIVNLAFKELQSIFAARLFPMPAGMFNRLRRIIVLAGKEATYVQREQAKRDLAAHASSSTSGRMLAEKATNVVLDTFITGDSDDQGTVAGAQGKNNDGGNKSLEAELEGASSHLRPVPVIWRIARQTRLIVLASYMLYINNPEQAIWPAMEASDYYRHLSGSQILSDPCIQYLSRIALPIAAQGALLFGDFELASNLLEVIEADADLPVSEQDQLEQMSVSLFSEYDISSTPAKRKDNYQLHCGQCNRLLPPYCGLCEKCNWQAPICMRTGQPIRADKMDKALTCTMCRSMSTVGKASLVVCPLCHEPY